MRIILAILFLAVPCMGAPKAPGVSRASMSVPINKVGDTFHGKVGNVVFEVGAIVSNKIKPQLKLVKWGEDTLTVNFPSMGSINKTGATCNGSTVTFVCHAGKLNVYVTDDGHLEYEGVFNSVPWSSVQLTLTGWEAFDFLYQPPLTAEQIAGGITIADNLIGSYSVRHKTKKNNQYGTGKAFHIYRPCWIAADGQRLWINQTIVNGVWTLSWNKAWTDAAAKPLRLDPTIGYTEESGYDSSGDSEYFLGARVVAPVDGTMTSMSVYTKITSGSGKIGMALYTQRTGASAPGNLIANSYTGEIAVTNTSYEWKTSGALSVGLTAGTTYWICFQPNSNDVGFKFDIGEANSGFASSGNMYFLFPNTWAPFVGASSANYSVYLTYSTGGGSPAPSVPFLPPVMTWEN